MNQVSLLLLLMLVGPVLVSSQYLGRRHANGRKRMFLIAIGHDYGAYEYIDTAGYLTGFSHDIIDAVCLEAQIDCRTIWDRSDNVWTSEPGSQPSGGRGLHDRWYDGSSGWDTTRERVHVFQFSMPYTRILKSYFYYKKGNTFDERDLKDKVIGFAKGWASDEKCVANQQGIANNVMETKNIKYYDNRDDFLEALEKNDIQAAFADEFTFSTDDIAKLLTYVSDRPYVCILAGNGIMTRKDNDFVEYWNIGFQKLTYTQRYQKLCQEGTDKHGHRGDLLCLGR